MLRLPPCTRRRTGLRRAALLLLFAAGLVPGCDCREEFECQVLCHRPEQGFTTGPTYEIGADDEQAAANICRSRATETSACPQGTIANCSCSGTQASVTGY